MPLPSFLQSMFTPQRSGPGQMAWRDRDVGEGSGEISQGDIQEMYWKRGPAARGHGQQMTSAVRPQEGLGQSGAQEVAEGISKMTGLEPGGMTSITEVMQSTPVGDEFGGAPAMSYATPSDPMGGGLDRMLGDSRFGGGAQPSYSMRDEFAEEGPGMFSQGPTTVGDPGFYGAQSAPGSFQHMDTGVQDTFAPGYNAGIQDSPPSFAGRRGPTAAVGDWFGEVFSGAGPTPTPGIGVGQTDPATGVPALVSGGPMGEFFSNVWERGTGGGTPVPTPGIQPGQTDPALGVPAPLDGHWPEWLQRMFARSTQGGSGRTRMGR